MEQELKSRIAPLCCECLYMKKNVKGSLKEHSFVWADACIPCKERKFAKCKGVYTKRTLSAICICGLTQMDHACKPPCVISFCTCSLESYVAQWVLKLYDPIPCSRLREGPLLNLAHSAKAPWKCQDIVCVHLTTCACVFPCSLPASQRPELQQGTERHRSSDGLHAHEKGKNLSSRVFIQPAANRQGNWSVGRPRNECRYQVQRC